MRIIAQSEGSASQLVLREDGVIPKARRECYSTLPLPVLTFGLILSN
jgi:hypothetical protein